MCSSDLAGVASRREAERLIAAGRVAVDGTVITSPALDVAPDAVITLDGNPLPKAERTRLWRYHKPRERLVRSDTPGDAPPRKPGFHDKKFAGKKKFGGGNKKFGGKPGGGYKGKNPRPPQA